MANRAKKTPKGVRQRKDGRYEYRYLTKSGERKSLYASSEAEIKQKIDELNDMVIRGVNLNKSAVTIDDVYKDWKENKVGIKNNTLANYKYMYERYVYGKFGKNKVRDILFTDVENFYKSLYNSKQLKAATIDAIHTVLHQVFQRAIKADYIRFNPASGALTEILKDETRKKNDSKLTTIEITYLTKEEQNLLFNYLKNDYKNDRWYRVFKFIIRTGLRAGEFAALQWEDFDFKEKWINVNKTVVVYMVDENKKYKKRKTIYEIHSTKTSAGMRKIPLSPELEKILFEEKQYQEDAELRCKTEVNGFSNFAFLTCMGTFYKDSTLNKALDRVIAACNADIVAKSKNIEEENIKYVPRISCHKFRHTFNTELKESNVMCEDRMQLLGQKDERVNKEVYTHSSDDSLRKAMLQYNRRCEEVDGMTTNDPKNTPNIQQLVTTYN